MSINNKNIKITMPLYETDVDILQKFIVNQKIESEINSNYLILYDFAIDCQYAEILQSDLVQYLIPFYLKAVESVNNDNEIGVEVYSRFNSAMFLNKENFQNAIGIRTYNYIMEYYITQTIARMEYTHILDWITIFNTTVALNKTNIFTLLKKIFQGSLRIKYSFFKYISIFLFKESDNLFVTDENEQRWTECVWWFDTEISVGFFWSDDVIEYFDIEVSKEKIESLFKEIKPLLYDVLEVEIVDLISEEIDKSFITGIFEQRKTEYLKKINDKITRHQYWYNY